MHFGIVTPPVPGHLHPFGALGRELIRRGHCVTVFHMADLESRIRAEGLEFVPIGASDHPAGSLPASLTRLAQLDGLAALRFTIKAVRKTSEMVLRDGPSAMSAAGVEALLVDQMEPAGGAIAEHLRIPFVTICNALLLNEEPSVPPPFTDWPRGDGLWAQVRNRAGYAIGHRTMRPVTQTVERYRAAWGLRRLRRPDESFSRLAQVCQLPKEFDFPRQNLPETFHYVGPLREDGVSAVPFPWDRLDGRPLVYASLGTLQNRRLGLFRLFAEACEGLNVQLVLTHGGGLEEAATREFPGNPVIVSYAPQREVLARAALTLTHAGLNTVLDSLSMGVPLVTIPITYEQPAIASRVRWAGVGETIRMKGLTAAELRRSIERVLGDASYRRKAEHIRSSIAAAGGVRQAADIIDYEILKAVRCTTEC